MLDMLSVENISNISIAGSGNCRLTFKSFHYNPSHKETIIMALTTRQVIQVVREIMKMDEQKSHDILIKLVETNPDIVANLLIPGFDGKIVKVRCVSVSVNRLKFIAAVKEFRLISSFDLADSKKFIEGNGTFSTTNYQEFSEAMEKHGVILEIVS